ncbi:hypothetical protein BLA29_013787 [Euroglyphus maynei]|uniref:Uncharacterized protein n=1 Tax=Euroglyphus maynei TaxID=6958 RepID=A0A1Y3BPK7_EURMA|nr:hypothetical protein BLA29_013787 [Euroglyphus maynei]
MKQLQLCVETEKHYDLIFFIPLQYPKGELNEYIFTVLAKFPAQQPPLWLYGRYDFINKKKNLLHLIC